ncbi:hypothetical protein [Candidatus Tisiphia endosymbiont of Hybos culiciformis]|uniref:hypothetical protein n=1 Tax=Candidatus Tisiphia endosymbiont of Hybos culiciformis TaxID=3139331 RepID=UPI003CCAB34F
MIKNITIVRCHSREGGNLDTCFRRYDTKFVSPNSIGFTIYGRVNLSIKKIKNRATKEAVIYSASSAIMVSVFF